MLRLIGIAKTIHEKSVDFAHTDKIGNILKISKIYNMVDVYFTDIRSQILREIEIAEKSIWVAVYWFTNQELFDKLLLKLKIGVSVQLVIHNDYINNRDTGLTFQKLIDAGCNFYFSDNDNPMHNKFCIIDQKVLINGSYNWTYYAESKNRENILILKEEREVISAFESEFFRIVKHIKPLKSIKHITKFEVEENNLLGTRDYLAYDIIYKAKATNNSAIVESAFEMAPYNLDVQKTAYALNLIRKYKLKYSVSISLIHNQVKLIAKKGASIPATFTTVVRTTSDNQPKSETDIMYGENSKASENSILAKMSLDGLPPKPAGKAEVKFTFSVDIDGKVQIEKMSLDNGKKEVITQKAIWLIEES